MSESMRINKYLAACGLASRRKAEALVLAGRVYLNDKPVRDLATTVDPASDTIKVDGIVVEPMAEHVYVMLNKPVGVLTTQSDPHGRPTVAKLVRDIKAPINPVGRLDLDSEGALFLTNDGELAFRLTHPRYQVPKVYEALVEGKFTDADSEKIADGMKLEDGALGRGQVSIIEAGEKQSTLHLTMREGRKREVRQLCALVGHPVTTLKRLSFGGVALGDLAPGQYRYLDANEIRTLKQQVGLTE